MPANLEIFPAHGEGSLCGKGMSSKSISTIGFEKINNPVLNLTAETFEKQMKQSFPERPKSFSHIIKTNKNGAQLLVHTGLHTVFRSRQGNTSQGSVDRLGCK